MDIRFAILLPLVGTVASLPLPHYSTNLIQKSNSSHSLHLSLNSVRVQKILAKILCEKILPTFAAMEVKGNTLLLHRHKRILLLLICCPDRILNFKLLHQLVAFLIALNYFMFQVELFEEEYEATHAKHCDEVSFTVSSLNWESFDKENAPKAFVFNPFVSLQILISLPREASQPLQAHQPFRIVRDKSPPLSHL